MTGAKVQKITTQQLPRRIYLHSPQVKFVIIDSITFHFRQDFDDLALRTRVLGGLSLKLMKLAKKFSLAEAEVKGKPRIGTTGRK